VNGIARSPWEAQGIRFLELELVGVGPRGHAVDSVRAKAGDVVIHTNDSSPFHLVMNLTGAEARTDLYYDYRFHENEDELGGIVGDDLQRSLVRNACEPAQHRAG
jgi:hypothetical protein